MTARRFDPKPATDRIFSAAAEHGGDAPPLSPVPGVPAALAVRLPQEDLTALLLLPESLRETQARWLIKHPDVPAADYEAAQKAAAEAMKHLDDTQQQQSKEQPTMSATANGTPKVRPVLRKPELDDRIPGGGFLTYNDLPEADYAAAVTEAEGGYTGPGVFELGNLTDDLGQEILLDGQVIDWMKGKPLTAKNYPPEYQGTYNEYRQFYITNKRQQHPPPVRFAGKQQIDDYLKTIPDPYELISDLTTEDGREGNIVIPANELTMLLAEPEQGKTWWMIYCAKELAYKTNKPVLYIATEAGPSIAARMQQLQIDNDDIHVYYGFPTAPDITALAEEQNWGAILIDVLAPFLEDENSPTSWNTFIRYTRPLVYNRTTLLAHHEGKTSGKGARGHSALNAAMTSTYRIQQQWNERLNLPMFDIIRHKDRNGYRPTGMRMTLHRHPEDHHLIAETSPRPANSDLDGEETRTLIVAAYRKAKQHVYQDKQVSATGIRKVLIADHGWSRDKADNAILRNDDLFKKTPGGANRGGIGLRLTKTAKKAHPITRPS